MKKVTINGCTLWQFDNFSSIHQVRHFVSGRKSVPGKKEFTLSYSSSPDRQEIEHNRKYIAVAMDIPEHQLFFPSQVHQTKIVQVTNRTRKEELMETDALITNETGLGIAVMSADCVPILVYDSLNNAAAAVHSGWRGTVARILEKTLSEMETRFGTKGENVIAGIGPSVCQDSYEVGEEVIESVLDTFGNQPGLLVNHTSKKAHLDLWLANKLQLLEFGVPEERIEIANLCTVKNNSEFFSARKGDTGRFAAGISLVRS